MINRLLQVIADIKSEGGETAISALIEYMGAVMLNFCKVSYSGTAVGVWICF